MAWPASKKTLAVAVKEVDDAALAIQRACQKIVTDSAAGEVTRKSVLNLLGGFDAAIRIWDENAQLAGIGAYVREQKADPGLDPGAEFSAMRTATIDLRDWINTNFPRDEETGAALTHVYDNAGNWTALTFTSAQMAGFRTRAQVLIDAIS